MKFIKLFLPLVDIYLAFNIWILKMFRKFLSKFNKKKADHGQDHDSDSDSTMKDLKNEIKERIRQRTKEFEKLNDLKLSFAKYNLHSLSEGNSYSLGPLPLRLSIVKGAIF